MTAHQETEASPPPSSGDRVEDFAEFLDRMDETPEEEKEDEIPEGDEPEGDEAEAGDEPDEAPEDDGDEADESPPIDPPVSWDGDAKEAFKQLPPELQKVVVEREAQRDRALQQKTTEASEAKRNAAIEASQWAAEQQRQYASQLEQYAALFVPEQPDPTLASSDPQAYIEQLAYYNAGLAQYQQMMQQAATAKQEADTRDANTRQARMQRDEEALARALGDDWTDPTKRQALLTDLNTVGAELGYRPEVLATADAEDVLALRTALEWKRDAIKYRKLQKDKMAHVRAAKDLPRVSKPGTSASRTERSARSADAAWQRAKQSRSGADFAAVLENMGVKL